jgi:hypothetical protein
MNEAETRADHVDELLGIACVIPENLRTCLGQRMMLFRLDTTIALPEYFAAVLNSTLILSEVKRLTGGAASPHLNIRDIRTFPIPLPPIVEQRQIVGQLDEISTENRNLGSIYEPAASSLHRPTVTTMNETATSLIAYCREHARVCPLPQKWNVARFRLQPRDSLLVGFLGNELHGFQIEKSRLKVRSA